MCVFFFSFFLFANSQLLCETQSTQKKEKRQNTLKNKQIALIIGGILLRMLYNIRIEELLVGGALYSLKPQIPRDILVQSLPFHANCDFIVKLAGFQLIFLLRVLFLFFFFVKLFFLIVRRYMFVICKHTK